MGVPSSDAKVQDRVQPDERLVELHPRHPRHHQVGENDVELLAGGEEVERILRGRHDGHVVAAEDATDRETESGLVVHDEHRGGPH